MMFKDIIGHQNCKTHFEKAIGSGHVSHAYILYGEKDSGKRSLAEAFAAAILCENFTDDSCGECKSCVQAKSRNHPDIIYLSPGEKKSISTKEIREKVTETAIVRPYYSKNKIYIIEGADKMHKNAQNALLKTLEEPPEYAVLILLAESSEALLQTIKSRCIQLFLAPIDQSEQIEYLLKNTDSTKEEAKRIVSFSGGNLGKALALVDDETFWRISADVEKIASGLGCSGNLTVPEAVKTALTHKDEIYKFFELLELWFKDVLLCKTVDKEAKVVYTNAASKVKTQAKNSRFQGIDNILKRIDKAFICLESNVGTELILEDLMITIKENT